MQNKNFKKFINIVVFSFWLFPFFLFADNHQKWEKGLKAILQKSEISDSLKIAEISGLSLIYFDFAENDFLDQFLETTLPLANNPKKNDLRLQIYSTALLITDDVEVKMQIMDSCLYYLEKSTDAKIRSIGWLNISKMQMEDTQALDYLIKALDEIEGKNWWRQEVDVYKAISTYYSHQKNYKNHIKYAELTLESARKTKDIDTIINALNDLGVAYYQIPSGDYLDEAIEIFFEGIDLYKENLADKRFEENYSGYMFICINLAKVYLEKNDLDSASKYLNEALIIALEYNAPEYQAECYINLSEIENEKKNYANVEKYLLKAEALLPDLSSDDPNTKHISYRVILKLAEFYTKTGEYKKAVEYYITGLEEYKGIYDAQMTTESQKLITVHEIKKKKEEIQDTKSLLDLKKNQSYMYIAVACILLIVLGLIFFLFRYKMRISKQNEKLLTDEAELLKLEKERIRLDNILKYQEAEHLQKQLVIGGDLIENKNKTLEDLKIFLANHSELNEYKSEIESILTKLYRIENNVEEFKTGLQDIPVDFYVKLQKKADNKLTPLDLKYCRLIYLKTPLKDMADLLFVDPKSVRVGKYRLKQKLELGKDDDLTSFIENLINESIES